MPSIIYVKIEGKRVEGVDGATLEEAVVVGWSR